MALGPQLIAFQSWRPPLRSFWVPGGGKPGGKAIPGLLRFLFKPKFARLRLEPDPRGLSTEAVNHFLCCLNGGEQLPPRRSFHNQTPALCLGRITTYALINTKPGPYVRNKKKRLANGWRESIVFSELLLYNPTSFPF